MLEHLLRRATADTFRARLAGQDLSALQSKFDEGAVGRDRRPGRRPRSCCARSAPFPGLAALLDRLEPASGPRARRPSGSPPPRSSSRWRGCTCCAGWPRTTSAASARCTEADRWPARPATGTARGTAGPTRWSRRSTYARALDEIGDDVLAGASPSEALRRPAAAGCRGRPARAGRAAPQGPAAARQAAPARPARRHAGAGPRAARPGAGGRAAGAVPGPGRLARFAEAQLDALPNDPARAVRRAERVPVALGEARQTYEEIKDLLRREVLDSQFRGMRDALRGGHARRTWPGSGR